MAIHYDPQRHHRRSIRLRGYDYAATGIYYVTICSFQYQHVFGRVVNEEMSLSDTGNTVEDCWLAIPEHFPGVSLGEWVTMPNHIHGIIVIGEEEAQVRATHASPILVPSPVPDSLMSSSPTGPKRRSIGAIVGSFKSAASKRINEYLGAPSAPIWQRNYYEHIIRDEADLVRIQIYITANLARWAQESEIIPLSMD